MSWVRSITGSLWIMAANAASLRSGVLGGYRRLLRLRNKVFYGDAVALVESKKELRTQIEINRHVKDSREISELIRGMADVEEMLGANIVQGKLNDQGNYEVRLRADTHLKDKEHEMITHVDDRLTGKTVVVESTQASSEAAGVIVNSSKTSSADPRK